MQISKYANIKPKGMSLLEVLVVVAIFAILGIIVARSVILTLQGSQKSESTVRARENLDYVLSIIERQVRGASQILPCPNADTTKIDYVDSFGVPSSFSCVTSGQQSYVASGSARLTNEYVVVDSCSFSCVPGTSANAPYIGVDITIKDATGSAISKSQVSATTQIYLRNY